MGSNRRMSASCVVIKDSKVLLERQTYGPAKGKYLIPGGFGEAGEMPEDAAEREVYEETGVHVKVKELVALRFTKENIWCIFQGEYVSGTPRVDGMEVDDVRFMDIEEALRSEKVVETTRVILKEILNEKKQNLGKSEFVNRSFTGKEWQLYI